MSSTVAPRANVHRLRRRWAIALAIATMGLAAAATVPSQANASAYGIQYWTAFHATIFGQNVGIPAGQLAHKIDGDGRYINYEWAHITAGPGFCNWRVIYVYRNVHNKVKRRIKTRIHYRCDTWAYAPTVHPGYVPYGTACAQLYRSGQYVTRQCHSITK